MKLEIAQAFLNVITRSLGDDPRFQDIRLSFDNDPEEPDEVFLTVDAWFAFQNKPFQVHELFDYMALIHRLYPDGASHQENGSFHCRFTVEPDVKKIGIRGAILFSRACNHEPPLIDIWQGSDLFKELKELNLLGVLNEMDKLMFLLSSHSIKLIGELT